MRRAGLAGAVAAVALFFALASGALGHKEKLHSAISGAGQVLGNTAHFAGVVTSDEDDACIRGRTVQLFDVRTTPSLVGETKTNSRGEWRISDVPTARLRGTQVIQLKPKKIEDSKRHKHTCSGAKATVDLGR